MIADPLTASQCCGPAFFAYRALLFSGAGDGPYGLNDAYF